MYILGPRWDSRLTPPLLVLDPEGRQGPCLGVSPGRQRYVGAFPLAEPPDGMGGEVFRAHRRAVEDACLWLFRWHLGSGLRVVLP
jgi:hypothetical protein